MPLFNLDFFCQNCLLSMIIWKLSKISTWNFEYLLIITTCICSARDITLKAIFLSYASFQLNILSRMMALTDEHRYRMRYMLLLALSIIIFGVSRWKLEVVQPTVYTLVILHRCAGWPGSYNTGGKDWPGSILVAKVSVSAE